MSSPNFFAELKRRNVYKVAVAYAVVAWLLIQVATQVFPFFDLPNWSVQFLGKKDLALNEGRRAVGLTPLEKDVVNGSRVLQYFAITAAWGGRKRACVAALATGLRAPAASLMVSYGALKLFPVWYRLRGDPRFEKSSPR